MRVLQTLGWYFPDSVGGTEVYVAGLCSELIQRGIDIRIAAPRNDSPAVHEVIDGVPAFRYPVFSERTQSQIEGSRPHGGFDSFQTWIDQQQADIYHQHSITYGCNVHHLRAARAAGMRTVLTVHTPGILCLRGTMLRNGATVCDGEIIVSRCASCWLQSKGSPSVLTSLLSHVPPALSSGMRRWGRMGTAMAATSLASGHRSALQEAIAQADKVVAVCQWLYDALLGNGVSQDKLVLSRQGIFHAHADSPQVRPAKDALVIGFLGRGDPVKGVAVLVAAVRQLPRTLPIRLQLHVVESNEVAARDYLSAARQLGCDDERIEFLPALAPAAVPAFLAGIDVLAVPSQWLETGPLVVLEAFAAGVPVVGSALGGIAELVRHGENGLLVQHDDVAAWAAAIRGLCADAALLETLRRGIGSVRTMADAAQDMHGLYAALTNGHP